MSDRGAGLGLLAWPCGVALTLLLSASTSVAVPAFPTAEGYGANAKGGRGGVVIYVTSLADSGPPWPSCQSHPAGCTLRSALTATVPRTVLFRVGGTIELLSRIDLGSQHSYLTLAGQTAPGDGIQIKNFGINLVNGIHDVILRHIRIRPGYALMTAETFAAHDALSIVDARDVIIDHCSVEWGPDETLSVWQGSQNVTVQWSIISEGPALASLPQFGAGASLGFLSGGHPRGVNQLLTVHHNLISNVAARAPAIGAGTAVDVRNNVIYNWESQNAALLGSYQSNIGSVSDSGSPKINFVANYYKGGPGSGSRIGYLGGLTTRVYLAGNFASGCPGGCPDPWTGLFSEHSPLINTENPGPYSVKPLATCSGSCVPRSCRDCYPAGDGTCENGPTFACDQGKCAGGPFAGRSCSAAVHCADNGRGCEIRGQSLQAKFAASAPFPTPSVVTTTALVAYGDVLDRAGAMLPRRDSLDARIIAEARSGTGAIGCGATGVACNLPEHWPVLNSAQPLPDSDLDGMPDAWEQARGLNPADPNDGNKDANGNGYTDLEDYLNDPATTAPPPPILPGQVPGLRRDDVKSAP